MTTTLTNPIHTETLTADKSFTRWLKAANRWMRGTTVNENTCTTDHGYVTSTLGYKNITLKLNTHTSNINPVELRELITTLNEQHNLPVSVLRQCFANTNKDGNTHFTWLEVNGDHVEFTAHAIINGNYHYLVETTGSWEDLWTQFSNHN